MIRQNIHNVDAVQIRNIEKIVETGNYTRELRISFEGNHFSIVLFSPNRTDLELACD